ncbi:MAG: M20/M25/M40 family metallo-hydrolase [Candidatus Bipolaricaulota bacterium]
MFLAHLDVFPAYEHPEAFTPRLQGTELIGRGAVDTKGQIAALLVALFATRGPAEVALVVDEEHLGRGSESLQVRPETPGAVVLEPTGLRIAPAEAGSIGLAVLATGTPAHGTMPWRGRSAIEHGFSLYRKLRRLPFMKHHHTLFDRGAWVNLGRIHGGYDTMVVPNRCELDMDIGFAPGLTAAAVEEVVREALSKAEAVQITDIWEPWETDPGAEIIESLAHALRAVLGEQPKQWGMPSWTDGAHLVQKGVPTVIFGAGDLAVAHTWRESLPLSELHVMSKVLSRLISSGHR